MGIQSMKFWNTQKEKRQRLNELEHYETYIENLRSQTEAAQKEMQSCAEKLSKIRKKAAIPLQKKIKPGLRILISGCTAGNDVSYKRQKMSARGNG
mgnify:CR=1 FL=1